jgi:hypothetical protein
MSSSRDGRTVTSTTRDPAVRASSRTPARREPGPTDSRTDRCHGIRGTDPISDTDPTGADIDVGQAVRPGATGVPGAAPEALLGDRLRVRPRPVAWRPARMAARPGGLDGPGRAGSPRPGRDAPDRSMGAGHSAATRADVRPPASSEADERTWPANRLAVRLSGAAVSWSPRRGSRWYRSARGSRGSGGSRDVQALRRAHGR